MELGYLFSLRPFLGLTAWDMTFNPQLLVNIAFHLLDNFEAETIQTSANYIKEWT